MVNPFAPFSRPLLDAFIRAGKQYFIRQSFPRAKSNFDEGIKGYFIITHYADIAHAQHHLGAISEDPYRFMYEWPDPFHREKLIRAASHPAGYKIYSSVFERDWETQVRRIPMDKTRAFIEATIGWQPGRGDAVEISIYVNYGELYAKLKMRRQEVRVKLEDIEKFRQYAPSSLL